jgi:hypothetical protein
MESQESASKLSERKVVRRGLIAGLAGLGAAAMLKVTGQVKAEPAEAAPAALLFPNAPGDSDTNNTSYAQTVLRAGAASFSIVLVVDGTGATSGNDGIHGRAKGGYGVVGTGGTSFGNFGGIGVGAFAGNSSHSGQGAAGMYAQGGSNSGTGTGGPGVWGIAGAGTPSAKDGPGVHGQSGGGKGVFGQSTTSDGVHGHSTFGVGLRGTSPNFVGLVGISDYSIGLYGYNVAPNVPALFAESLAPSARIAAVFSGDVRVQGNFTVLGGAKSAAVAMPDGSEALVYCQEAPEPYFEDFGRGQLANGVARLQLEPEFAAIVKRDDYMVFITPNGEPKGALYVAQQNANGFEVREAQGGSSNVRFTYRVVAKRKDIEGKRLARLDPAVKNSIAAMRSAAAGKNDPSVRVPPGGNPIVPLRSVEPVPSAPPSVEPIRPGAPGRAP